MLGAGLDSTMHSALRRSRYRGMALLCLSLHSSALHPMLNVSHCVPLRCTGPHPPPTPQPYTRHGKAHAPPTPPHPLHPPTHLTTRPTPHPTGDAKTQKPT